MSKYHDDRTAASDPGGMRLSVDLLRQVEPAFGEPRGADLDRDQHASRFLDRLDEHLQLGDTRAACCVSVEPFLVAAYSDELDCVAMLRFPDSLAERLALVPGSRLLTVNTYSHQPEFAPDLLPGPRQLGRYGDFYPVIADFVSEDRQRIAERRAGISEDEWRRCQRMGEDIWLLLPESGATAHRSIHGAMRSQFDRSRPFRRRNQSGWCTRSSVCFCYQCLRCSS